MLFWLFLLGVTFSFIIPAINFYLSERNISYLLYIFYILFSVVFVLFTFVKFNNLVLFKGIDLTSLYNYERLFNSIPALFYYTFLWNYVAKSDRTFIYRKILRYSILLTLIILPLITIIDVFNVNSFIAKLVTLIFGLIALMLAITLGILLLNDKKIVFKIIGLGYTSFLILVTFSLIIMSLGTGAFSDNPHKLYLIGMIIELTMLNYVLNLSNLEYRNLMISEKNTIEGLALRSQMNPHFVHNSLNAIQYFIQRNEVELSENYLSKFSQLIRLFFEYSRRQTVTIKEEIELLKKYLDIEILRFEEKLEYTIFISNKIDIEDQLIPSMLLQPIVENAVNHGLFHKQEKGTVSIAFHYVDESTFKVIVEDDGIGIKKAKEILNNPFKNQQSNSSIVLSERLNLLNSGNDWIINYSIIDNSEINSTKTGTCVTLTFKQPK